MRASAGLVTTSTVRSQAMPFADDEPSDRGGSARGWCRGLGTIDRNLDLGWIFRRGLARGYRHRVIMRSTSMHGWTFAGPAARRQPRNLLHGSGNPSHRAGKIGNVDQRQKQAADPEEMFAGEHREQAKHAHNFKLDALVPMGQVLGQRMQPKVENAKGQPRKQEGRLQFRPGGGRSRRRPA